MSASTIENDTAKGFKAITPNDTVDVDKQYNHSIFVEVGGNVAVEFIDGTTYTFLSVGAGQTIKAEINKVLATGTSASNIKGVKLYR